MQSKGNYKREGFSLVQSRVAMLMRSNDSEYLAKAIHRGSISFEDNKIERHRPQDVRAVGVNPRSWAWIPIISRLR